MTSFADETVLAADVGGTHCRVALHRAADGGELLVRDFDTATIGSTGAAIRALLDEARRLGLRAPSAAAAGAAGPVIDDRVQGVNLPFPVELRELREAVDGGPALLVNDFVALARAAPILSDEELVDLGGRRRRATTILVGPGTGFGTSVLLPDERRRSGWTSLPGEAGHMNVAPANGRQAELVAFARDGEIPVCCDDLLSGKGLGIIWRFLGGEEGVAAPTVAARARAGDDRARATFTLFFELLASVGSDLCLAVLAPGGLIVGGGVVPRNLDLLDRAAFRRSFAGKKEYGAILEAMPIRVIRHPRPGLLGAALLAADLRHDARAG